jgi:2-polyprenyl-3-methyl-5-hydroxy-6-metoxy-1,4-benzoquinol methylase
MGVSGYREDVSDATHMRSYASYQRRYGHVLRESDRELIERVRARTVDGASLLDVGCSTGSLLLHLSRLLPELELHAFPAGLRLFTARKPA